MRDNMKRLHEDMRDRLPEYVNAGEFPPDAGAHMESCPECKEEFSILSLLKEAGTPDAPEPGGMFFETLPQRIKVSLRENRKNSAVRQFIARLVPAVVLGAIVVTAVHFYKIKNTGEGYPFDDPLAYQLTELDGLNADDIPSIPDIFRDDWIYVADGNPFEYNYHREFASLNSKELKNLRETLTKEEKSGGVL